MGRAPACLQLWWPWVSSSVSRDTSRCTPLRLSRVSQLGWGCCLLSPVQGLPLMGQCLGMVSEEELKRDKSYVTILPAKGKTVVTSGLASTHRQQCHSRPVFKHGINIVMGNGFPQQYSTKQIVVSSLYGWGNRGTLHALMRKGQRVHRKAATS